MIPTAVLFRMNTVAAAIVSAGLLATTGAAHADQLSDLQIAVQKLQSQIEELKAQQAATPKVAPAPEVIINPPPAIPAATDINTASALVPVPRLLQVKTAGGSFMLYGDFDEYINHMHSSKGPTINAVQDGAILRSRWGLTGAKDFGNGYGAAFTLESGINGTNGAAGDQANANAGGLTTSGRLFDRQAWFGFTSPYGEVRFGRQNTDLQTQGNYIDYTERNLGSVVNSFGLVSRYDGDFAYLSPRIAGVQVTAHYALGGGGQQNTSTFNQGVAQLRVEELVGPFRIAYSGLVAKAKDGAVNGKEIYYHTIDSTYDYGRGTIYLNVARSNNAGQDLANTGGNLVGNIPSVTGNAVSNPNFTAATNYDIYQISADYRATSTLRIGGLWGKIKDSQNSTGSATGWSVGTYWQAFSNFTLYGLVDQMDNSSTGAFGLAGSAGLTKNFSGANLTGQKITGVQVGGLLRF